MIEPPYSPESEMAVICSILEDSSLMSKVSFLSSDDFYMMPHREIYALFESENAKGVEFDLFSLAHKITPGMGDTAYLADIMKTKSAPKRIISYGKSVLHLSIRRKAMALFSQGIESLADTSVDLIDGVSETSRGVDENISRLAVGDVFTVEQLIDKSVDEMEQSLQEARLGVSTGIDEIDERLGYQNMAVGEITYLGAQSKNGKTLFANTIAARSDLEENECCHIFSVEMPAIRMFNGVVSAISGVPSDFYARQAYYSKVLPSKYSEWMSKWGKAAQEINESGRITIDDRKDVTMTYICAEIRKQHQLMVNKGKVLRLVVIDHLHRISFDTSQKPMTYAMGDDVRMLKNTAAELGVSVLLLGQLNESCKDRDPTAFDILDTSRVRHEIQCFIGTRIFREAGGTYFGIYSDAHRYADHETKFHPGYMQMIGGVVKSLDESNKNWQPSQGE